MKTHMNKINPRSIVLKASLISGFLMTSLLMTTSAFCDYSTHVVGKIRSVNQSYVEITGHHIIWQVALNDLSVGEVDRVKSQIASQKNIEVWVPASRLKYRVENAPSDQDRLPANSQGWSNYL